MQQCLEKSRAIKDKLAIGFCYDTIWQQKNYCRLNMHKCHIMVKKKNNQLSLCTELGYKIEFHTGADTGKLNNIF